MLHALFVTGYVIVIGILLTIASSTLAWMLDSWRTPAAVDQVAYPEPDRPRLSFTLLVPARHEQLVLGRTVDRLLEQDHDDFDVILIVGHDDPETADVAHRLADVYDNVSVVTDHHVDKNKPRALNTALPHVRGDIVGVIDAEDMVAPALLRHVDTAFRADQAHVVQGGVQLMNFETSWWSLRNVLEYFFWFSSRLHFHARNRFIPLGGNTVFVRTDLLRQVGGWDGDCLAEDCELGVRLSSIGARVTVAFEPELATREETPPTIKGLYKQRTRWNQGFLQVLVKREWRRLPTRRQRSMAIYLLVMPFLQALAGVMIPVSLFAMVFLRESDVFVMFTYIPLLPTIATVGIEIAGLREFGRLFDVKVRWRHYVKLVLGTVPYQLLLAAAAVRATVRELRGVRGWEKTEHIGAHLGAAAVVEEPAL